MKKIFLYLVVLILLTAISLSSHDDEMDCLRQLYEKMKFHQSGECGYSGHAYNAWIIDGNSKSGTTRSIIYGDSISPLYGKVEFRMKIANHLNKNAKETGYDTTWWFSWIEAGDIELNVVYRFNCCPEYDLIKYQIYNPYCAQFIMYSISTDEFYILNDIFNKSIKASYNGMIADWGNNFEFDPACKTAILLSIGCNKYAPTVLKEKEDLIPAIAEGYGWVPHFIVAKRWRELYFYEPYSQADGSGKATYDSIMANNDMIASTYHEILDSLNDHNLKIIPPDWRFGTELDTMILTTYQTSINPVIWWFVIYTKEGFLDTIMAKDSIW